MAGDCLVAAMTSHPPYQVSVTFASLVGAAGFVLAVQAWSKFRGTPFGRVLSALPAFMLVIALYHPILLVFPEYLELALAVESLGFALLVLFAVLAIRLHRRMTPGGA